MAFPIAAEILEREFSKHPSSEIVPIPHNDFLVRSSFYRAGFIEKLKQWTDKVKVTQLNQNFRGFSYDAPFTPDTVVRVYCGANERDEVLLQVSIHPKAEEGILNPWGSNGYVLQEDGSILIQRNGKDVGLLSGRRDFLVKTLSGVEVLGEEIKQTFDKKFLAPAQSTS